MVIKASNMKMWSRMGSRAAYGMAMLELGKEHPDLLLLTGDTSTSAGGIGLILEGILGKLG